MCLAIPGKVVGTEERSGLRVGRVQFGGIIREASLDFVPEAQVGDYVLARIARGFSLGSGMASVADLSLGRSPKAARGRTAQESRAVIRCAARGRWFPSRASGGRVH